LSRSSNLSESGYGQADQSYQAAGGLTGITQLVDDFYANMDSFPEAWEIRQMHGADLADSKQKLSYFLSGWLGGPKLYAEHYGGISIPGFHQALKIDAPERDAWLYCMQEAIAQQPFAAEFKAYLLTQLRVPAERVFQASVLNRQRARGADPAI